MKNSFEKELTENILPYWALRMPDITRGGFYGRIDGCDTLHRDATRGAVLNMRILWTFSAAYRILGDTASLQQAQRAFDYNRKYFIDPDCGGVFWELNSEGVPVSDKKQVYAQAFAIYGFSEFYRATGNFDALQTAIDLFQIIESRCRDRMQEGYFEAFTRNWQPIDDMRLSSRDANEKKTTNTHLHVLEAYSNLYRVWKDYRLGDALRQLIDIFRLHIVDSLTGHQKLFFDTDWTAKGDLVSYGHDIEAAWLLLDAAETLGDASLVELTKKTALQLAEAATSGLQPDGSMIYEKDGNHTDADRHWWVQAEAVTGYMHAYRISGDSRYLQYSRAAWEYIQHNLIDREKGEWYWSRRSDGSINRSDDKAGFWKCPYHNSRMCFEMMNSAE